MTHQKEIYTKTDITQTLGLQFYILSLWEKEFSLETIKAADGQTLYTSQAYAHLKKIKQLIYEKGYSLEAAKKALLENHSEIAAVRVPAFFEPAREQKKTLDPALISHLKNLQKQLIKLRNLL